MSKKEKRADPLFLIVDDEPDCCWALERFLGQKGYRAQSAPCGQAAIALVAPSRFQLAFLDSTLPDMDGFELASQLRAIDPHLIMVIVSGSVFESDDLMRQAKAKGLIRACVAKPFWHKHLLRLIKTLLHSPPLTPPGLP